MPPTVASTTTEPAHFAPVEAIGDMAEDVERAIHIHRRRKAYERELAALPAIESAMDDRVWANLSAPDKEYLERLAPHDAAPYYYCARLFLIEDLDAYVWWKGNRQIVETGTTVSAYLTSACRMASCNMSRLSEFEGLRHGPGWGIFLNLLLAEAKAADHEELAIRNILVLASHIKQNRDLLTFAWEGVTLHHYYRLLKENRNQAMQYGYTSGTIQMQLEGINQTLEDYRGLAGE